MNRTNMGQKLFVQWNTVSSHCAVPDWITNSYFIRILMAIMISSCNLIVMLLLASSVEQKQDTMSLIISFQFQGFKNTSLSLTRVYNFFIVCENQTVLSNHYFFGLPNLLFVIDWSRSSIHLSKSVSYFVEEFSFCTQLLYHAPRNIIQF